MGVVHPHGAYHVELPYESTREITKGMSHGRRDMYQWIRDNCAPVSIRTTIYHVSWSREHGSTKKSRIHFLTKDEAILFKLTWGGM